MDAARTSMGQGLFRPQALEAQRSARLGRVLINPPLTQGLIALVALAFVAALFVLLALTRYAPQVHARGVLQSAQRARLQLPASAMAGMRPGLPVRLSFAVYPYAGLHAQGQVTAIDPVPVAGTGRHAVYAVTVQLRAVPNAMVLPAGLPLRAVIVRPTRPLLRLFAASDSGARAP